MKNTPFSVRPNDGVCSTHTAQAGLDVLLGDEFGPLKLPKFYERLAKELGRDFPNIRFVAHYLPLFHDGARHKVLRQQSAVYLKSRAEAIAEFEQKAADLFDEKLGRTGQVEIIADIIDPVIEMAAEAITGLPFSPEVVCVFTTNNSLKMMRKIDSEFAALRKLAWALFPDDSAETHGIRVAFSTLGLVPLGASLAASFAKLLSNSAETRICALNWGTQFPATGVAIVGRECAQGPVDLGTEAHSVRICEVDMRHFLEEGGQPNHIFGVGSHACLGRSSALSLWSRIGAKMAQNPLGIRLISIAAPTHKILDYPSAISVEVLP
ncbi:MAG: hypothetical protein COB08_013615 [Rhodobacteraceae bacterium]|nr:hypothetical protein [Paracoccaceae bacterium]